MPCRLRDLSDNRLDAEESLVERERAAAALEDRDSVYGLVDTARVRVHGSNIEGIHRAQLVIEAQWFGVHLVFVAGILGLEEEAARSHLGFSAERPFRGKQPRLIRRA